MDWDRYAYVKNNPVNYNDPTGHDVGCSGYDASRCEGKINNLNFTLNKRKYTITPVVKYIYDEIMKNMTSKVVRTMKSFNSEPEGTLVASALWASKVAPGKEWDHKPKIQEMEEKAKRPSNYQQAGEREYQFDTWSNIHYGFVGREAGFSVDTLLDGAGAAQLAVDFLKGNKIQPDTSVSGARKYDQSADRTAIQIGMDLWNQYGYDLRPEDIIWAIEHSTGLNYR